MRKCRIAIIGAGSTYTPELMSGFIERRDRMVVDSFIFCDIDSERGEILTNMSRRMLKKAGMNAEISFCTDYHEAVRGADYVLTQIRVGKMPARILDERIPLRHGLLGQETTGIGGMVCALRTAPMIAEIAEAVRTEAAPGAWMINFSNPSGLVAEAVLGYKPDTRMIGLCNVPIKMEREAGQLLGAGAGLDCDFVGLNHLCWLTEVYLGGKGQLSQLLSLPLEQSGLNNIPDMRYSPEQLRAMGGFPCGYLNYYYFRDEMLNKSLSEEKTRGEICLELDRELLKLYADPSVDTSPELLSKRGGALYSESAVSLIESIENDSGKIHVVNVQNRGAMPILRPGDVAELRCRVSRDGAEPLPLRKMPSEHICGLVQSVKAYERLAARAALAGSYEDALAAALSHPLSADFDRTKAALDELLEAHREHLPRFEEYFKRKARGKT